MSKLRFSATSLIVTGLFLSCSDSGSNGGSVPIDDLPAKYAAAVCTALQNCVGSAVFLCTSRQRLRGRDHQAASRTEPSH